MAFTGVGQRLGPGQENTLPPWESISPSTTTPTARTAVPSLKDICLSTLDRYVDLLDDIGTTPYYLIESVLRKCNVKQLTRIELHTEGLSEETDELWYNHTLKEFGTLRKDNPVYDQSGGWRSKYQALKKEVEEKFAHSSARLRQNYSQYDQEKQERRVILDPSLKPKKTLRQLGSSSWSTPVAPKKKSLFEKARMEARKINPVVYLAPSKTASHTGTNHGGGSSNGSSMSPISPTRPAAHAKPAATSPKGAIMDFFNQINPAHSQQATSSHHGLNQVGSRSPTSPVQPASKTMQMLREPVVEKTTGSSSSSRGDRPGSTSSKKQDVPQAHRSGDTMKEVKIDGDFSWLEDDDDDDDDFNMDHGHAGSRQHGQHKRSHSGGHFQKGSPPAKKPLGHAQSSLDEATRPLF
ncbi:hypothetical protein BGZ97_004641 [Linnemannia gamsii]|uniref:Elongin-A n=1 Tax=Linnemannia gamsii TaxID=64522 RepID=A0A9P6QVJ4_9FUNG|nr:hypothetical protein BGZ97_004641 [Linnemannia gamsii]